MSKETDPASYESNFERTPKDRYWTERWVTEALLRRLDSDFNGKVWEPAVGRGDMLQVLSDNGCDMIASDIDCSEFDMGSCPSAQFDFIKDKLPTNIAKMVLNKEISAIITNPPYDQAEEFIRRAIDLAPVVAMLLRSEFNQAAGRADLFNQPPFAFEITLTTRPRWDWWFREKPEASPRFGFSWFVWDQEWIGPSTQFWELKKGD